jgi:hypothetical protein
VSDAITISFDSVIVPSRIIYIKNLSTQL